MQDSYLEFNSSQESLLYQIVTMMYHYHLAYSHHSDPLIDFYFRPCYTLGVQGPIRRKPLKGLRLKITLKSTPNSVG